MQTHAIKYRRKYDDDCQFGGWEKLKMPKIQWRDIHAKFMYIWLPMDVFLVRKMCQKWFGSLSLSPSVCVSQLWISRLLNDNKTHEFELCAFSNSLFLITRTNNIWIAYLRMGNRVDNIDWNSLFDKYCVGSEHENINIPIQWQLKWLVGSHWIFWQRSKRHRETPYQQKRDQSKKNLIPVIYHSVRIMSTNV